MSPKDITLKAGVIMTGPKRNSEFCSPETLNVSRGEADSQRNIEVEGKQNSLFPAGSIIKCCVIPPIKVKNREKTAKKSFA